MKEEKIKEVKTMTKKEKKKSRALFDDVIKCPYCSKRIHIKAEKETITPAVPAETELNITVEKDTQTTLKKK